MQRPKRGDNLGAGSLILSRPVLLALFQAFLLALCVVAGYLMALWWSDIGNTAAQLAQICAQVEYIDSLQQGLKEQQAPSKLVRDEFRALVEQCRTALRRRGESL
jgi:hypothetical protein